MASHDIGVLVPMRIETRFIRPGESARHAGRPDPDAPDEWRVRVRVVPDEVSIDRHDPRVHESEVAAVEAAWAALETAPDPADPSGCAERAMTETAWTDVFARVAAQVGAGRAAWLFRTVPVTRDADGGHRASPTATDPERAGAGVVRGLPRRLDLWVVWTDADDRPDVLARLEPRRRVREPLRPTSSAWLLGWTAAVRAGMAVEVALGDRRPEEIAVLGVSGLGPGDATTPGGLLQSHADAGRLGLLAPGRATSSVHGAPVAERGDTTAKWRSAIGTTAGVGSRLRTVAGPAAVVGPALVDEALDLHDQIAEFVVGASFPALFGYGLAGVLGVVPPGAVGPLWEFARRHVRPEGGHATIRIGEQAYGVLPIVDPAAVAPHAGPRLAGALPLLDLLARLLPRVARAAEADPGVVGGGVDDAVRTLRRGPVPGLVGSRRLVPVELAAALTGQDVGDRVSRWRDERRPALEALVDDVDAAVAEPFHGPPARAYQTRTARDWLVRIPLLGPTLDDPGATPSRIEQDSIVEHLQTTLAARARIEVGDGRTPPLGVSVEDVQFVDSLLVRLHARSMSVGAALLDVARVERLLAEGGAQPTDPPARLLEELLPRGGRTLTRRHAQALLGSGMAVADFLDPDDPLVTSLRWLEDATDALVDLVDRAEDAEIRRRVSRAVRALLDAASGRWDVWFPAVADAHLADAHDRGSTPTLGAYGWVDAPFRGLPGPGPGGLLLAPSEQQAATAAVLRDRAVRDAEPGRWAMALDSATIGPARRLLGDLTQGWHPAERTGRMVELTLRDRSNARGGDERRAELATLRAAFPLRVGQGAFGCCHGLDVLTALHDGTLAATDWASPELVAAVGEVAGLVDAAADLLAAEAVHDLLAGQPEQAAAATEVLAGQRTPPELRLLDPSRGGRGVHTVVLGAFPAVVPEAPSAGAATTAAPGLDAALADLLGGTTAFDVHVPVSPDGTEVVALAELGLRPLDLTRLDDDVLRTLARLAVRRRGGEPGDGEVVVPTTHETARRLAAAVRGRPADADDLRPPDPAAGSTPEALGTARATAVSVLAGRADRLRARCEALVARLATAVTEGTADVDARRAEELQAVDESRDPVPPMATGPGDHELAALVVELASWGLGPPPGVEDVLSEQTTDIARRRVLDHLADGHVALRARLGDAGRSSSPGDDDARAVLTIAGLGAELRALTGAVELAIGAPLPAALLGAPLTAAAGTDLEGDWLPQMVRVRPRVAELAGAHGDRGVVLHGHDVGDPWCLAELVPTPRGGPAPTPRLVVAATLGPMSGGELHEWVVIDAFTEHVPHRDTAIGLAFDASTPSASPPAAILVVPATDPVVGLTADDLPTAVLLARRLAHARMAGPVQLVEAGLGALTTHAVLPQDGDTGCPLVPVGGITHKSRWDDVAVLLPRTGRDDLEDVVGAVTADALWMLGVQWRLGEHAGEDAASPVALRVASGETPVGGGADRVPIEALVESPSGTSTWDPTQLHYDASFPSGGSQLDIVSHAGGPLDWWAIRANGVPRRSRGRSAVVVPGRLRWPGAPRSRFWQLDDPRRDPAGVGPDTGHGALLYVLDLLGRHGDDWYLAPLPVRTGTVVRPERVTLVDAAGGRWRLRSVGDWGLFAVAGLDDEPPAGPADDEVARWHRGLPVLATAGTALAGPPLEEVALTVDEDANVVWGAVLRRDGRTVERVQPTPPGPDRLSSVSDLDVEWRIADPPDPDRFPYLYGLTYDTAFGSGRDVFVQASRRDPVTGGLVPGPDVVLLRPPSGADPAIHVLEPLAVPAGGVRLVRQPMLARDVEGRPVAWVRHERRPLDVGVDVGWAWDPVTPTQHE